jgi:hypothetical protein
MLHIYSSISPMDHEVVRHFLDFGGGHSLSIRINLEGGVYLPVHKTLSLVFYDDTLFQNYLQL